MEQFFFKPTLNAHDEAEKLIYVASNGQGYVVNNELHICGNYHLIYKFTGDNPGWYMKNSRDNIDRYLGIGASPSVLISDIDIKDEEYFESIKYVQEEQEENLEPEEE